MLTYGKGSARQHDRLLLVISSIAADSRAKPPIVTSPREPPPKPRAISSFRMCGCFGLSDDFLATRTLFIFIKRRGDDEYELQI